MTTVPAEAADATEVTPLTADRAEQIARDLDAQRAEIATRYREHNRNMPNGADPSWSALARQLTDQGMALDKEKAAAWKRAKELRADEARRRQWEAAHAVHGEFKQICSAIVHALDAAIPALEAAEAMRHMLTEKTGKCQLHDLRCNLPELHRLRWSANLVISAKPERRNGVTQ